MRSECHPPPLRCTCFVSESAPELARHRALRGCTERARPRAAPRVREIEDIFGSASRPSMSKATETKIPPTSPHRARSRGLIRLSFPSSLLGPTVRAQVDPCAPLFGSRTSRRRYEWIVYDLSLEDVDRIEHGGGPGHVRNPDGPEHRSCNNFRSIEPALPPPAPPLAPCSALANKRERGRVALRNYRTLYFPMPSPLGEKPTFSFQSPEVVSTAENAPCSAQPNAR